MRFMRLLVMVIFSFRRSLIFVCAPFAYPPIEPSERITRWQGIEIGRGFLRKTFPTARAARGDPIARATSLYVAILPRGICFTASYTRSAKFLRLFDIFCGLQNAYLILHQHNANLSIRGDSPSFREVEPPQY